jgi:hypothetical protein
MELVVVEAKMSQLSMIRRHLEEGRSIDPMEALREYGCYRLGAIIFILRREGLNISTRLQCHKNKFGYTTHYAIYKLETEENKKCSI